MNFFNCFRLLQECVKAEILCLDSQAIANDRVLIFREAGRNPEKYPEGWYSENIRDVAQELMSDEQGQALLLEQLTKRGIPFEEYKDLDF